MLGIDIYRYQTVTDWDAVAAKVGFVWVKGTDGGGPAIARADGQVRGAQSVGIPVGLYHYAQLTPTPERQADVLAAEVRRLNADQVAPALDLEDPHTPGPAAREFAIRFLRRLHGHHKFARVAIYGNSSMFSAIRPDTWDIDGLIIWVARYGRNDGRRHPDLRPYTGRADIHQYTSVGTLPGITGHVDLNHALTGPPLTEDDMPTAAEVWSHNTSGKGVQAQDRLFGMDAIQLPGLRRLAERTEAKLDALTKVAAAAIAAPDIDEAAVARIVTTAIVEHTPTAADVAHELAPLLPGQLGGLPDEQFAALVDAVADENDRRARERANQEL